MLITNERSFILYSVIVVVFSNYSTCTYYK